MGGELADVDAVDEDLPLLDVVVPADQIEDRGLAGAGSAHEGHLLTGVDGKAHILEDIVLALIGEPHVAELDLAPEALRRHGLLRLGDGVPLVQHGEDLLRRCQGVLEGGELLRQLLDGPEEGANIVGEDIHGAQCQRSRQNGDAAAVHHRGQGEVGHEGDAGTEHGEHQQLPHLGAVQVLGAALELRRLFLLPHEDLDQLHAGDVLRQEGVQGGDLGADDTVDLAGHGPEPHRQGEDHRQKHEAQQGQAEVDADHHHRVAGDEHRIAEQLHQYLGVHPVQGLHVVGDPGHDAAHGVGVKKPQRQGVDVLKDLLPDIEDDVLAGALQEPDLRQLAHHRHHQHQQVEDADPLDALAVGAPQHAQLLPGQLPARQVLTVHRHGDGAAGYHGVCQLLPRLLQQGVGLAAVQIPDEIVPLAAVHHEGEGIRLVKILGQVESVKFHLGLLRRHVSVGPIVALDIIVDGVADEDGAVQVQSRHRQHQQCTDHHGLPVGFHVAQQTGERVAVVGELLLADRSHSASTPLILPSAAAVPAAV